MRLNDGNVLPWRQGGGVDEPMHRWYDKRLGMFDVLSESECRQLYAPRVIDGEVLGPEEWRERYEAQLTGADVAEPPGVGLDLRTPEEMLAAGMDVRFDSREDIVGGGGAADGFVDVIDSDAFVDWMILQGLELAGVLEAPTIPGADGFSFFLHTCFQNKERQLLIRTT